MTTPNELFDRIYCINLDRRIDRWNMCESLFAQAQLRVERFSAVDGKPNEVRSALSKGHVGCILSHLAIYREALAQRYRSILVLEDDLALCDDFAAQFASFVAQVPANWELLYLGCRMSRKQKRRSRQVGPNVVRVWQAWQTHAIALRPRAMQALLDLPRHFRDPIDNQWCKLTSRWFHPVIAYAAKPPLITQRADFSDITECERSQR